MEVFCCLAGKHVQDELLQFQSDAGSRVSYPVHWFLPQAILVPLLYEPMHYHLLSIVIQHCKWKHSFLLFHLEIKKKIHSIPVHNNSYYFILACIVLTKKVFANHLFAALQTRDQSMVSASLGQPPDTASHMNQSSHSSYQGASFSYLHTETYKIKCWLSKKLQQRINKVAFLKK